MLGCIAGDMVGSVYEGFSKGTKREDFPLFSLHSRFTDDTVLSVAVADAILGGEDFQPALLRWARRYPHAGYGGMFRDWMNADSPRPYRSFGNGSAMRAGPVGWAFDTLEDTLEAARASALPTHDHPEGIKGAQAVALAVWLARNGAGKHDIRVEVEKRIGYSLRRSLAEIRPGYRFDVTCQGSVPEAITAFLESGSLEDAIRKAVSLGGDPDTQACIAGAIAEAAYGAASGELLRQVRARLPSDLLDVVDRFEARFGPGN